MAEYRVTYKDGTTQTLRSPGPKLQGEWLIFQDGSGVQLCVRTEEVTEIIRVGTSERTSSKPKAA